MELGKTIKALRIKAGMTQAKAAKKSGILQPYIARIEGGAGTSFTLAVRILQALGYKLVVTPAEAGEIKGAEDDANKGESL